jgi:hypothetical protein
MYNPLPYLIKPYIRNLYRLIHLSLALHIHSYVLTYYKVSLFITSLALL